MPETTKTSDDDAAHLQVRLDPREQLQTVVVIPHPELASQALDGHRRELESRHVRALERFRVRFERAHVRRAMGGPSLARELATEDADALAHVARAPTLERRALDSHAQLRSVVGVARNREPVHA